MRIFEIEDRKKFMAGLFGTEFFYPFHLIKAEIKTCASFVIDGKVPKEGGKYISWEKIQEPVFQIIKGKKSPSLFFLVMEPEREWLEEKLNPQELSFCVNIRFEQKEGERKPVDTLLLTAGVSGADFLLAHQMEKEWEQVLETFLKEHGICFM